MSTEKLENLGATVVPMNGLVTPARGGGGKEVRAPQSIYENFSKNFQMTHKGN